jgi:hypothetical protein
LARLIDQGGESLRMTSMILDDPEAVILADDDTAHRAAFALLRLATCFKLWVALDTDRTAIYRHTLLEYVRVDDDIARLVVVMVRARVPLLKAVNRQTDVTVAVAGGDKVRIRRLDPTPKGFHCGRRIGRPIPLPPAEQIRAISIPPSLVTPCNRGERSER